MFFIGNNTYICKKQFSNTNDIRIISFDIVHANSSLLSDWAKENLEQLWIISPSIFAIFYRYEYSPNKLYFFYLKCNDVFYHISCRMKNNFNMILITFKIKIRKQNSQLRELIYVFRKHKNVDRQD